jgi:hypothetical protein
VRKASRVSISCQLSSSRSQFAFYLRKQVLRGALTNGRDWIFLLIKLDDDYDGASYKQSLPVKLNIMKHPDDQPVILRPYPDLIAAILSHWVSLMLIRVIELLIDWNARLKRAL